ncbi:carotenoid oxygenase family protein [Limnoraphis robusta Tam1]|uniref:Carotenoid oxygenase family protein n=1 Tax=Limnoraphis robusta CCNP1315 TaxID=3110306 RepID=A0ABU5TSD7_9CYAN|nr:carotenoid oxygenase family protein [Limnoraphis robusta]MEA5499499.1 carotenoid oxygenase family protein [Limnoraphis robusta BA-68 BA1]MEA5517620.1 carotenoid oxygenase family protein [Limnoraphis robusta CCNP1315]MEA5541360.1 carotenoid oxygenase family protein [Limnoraphis robusta Tam1]MEA5545748.1 carotenoid oxygenase family protein [Limnoraphis robusta CCNP1324]
MTSTVATNPYLEGNFAPVRDEITADNLKVIGELPAGLSGMFLRNGSNPQFSPIGQYHWFDGDGMIHGVQLQNGKASYRNRYVRTHGYNIEHKAGTALWSGMFEPPQQDLPGGPSKNTANTALVWHAGKFLALWEGGNPHALTLPDINTIGAYDFDGELTCAFTAHPKVDPQTGEMRFIGYSMITPPYLHYGWVAPDGKLKQINPIELPVGVMMHDFAITENYTIFMDLPLTFRPERMQRGEPPMMFERETPSRFGIVPRHGDNSQVKWFECPSCFIFHTLNAYEQGDEVVLIASRMEATTILFMTSEENADIPLLYRWRFNLKTGEVKQEQLGDTPAEFPVINNQFTGRQNRYGYAGKIAPVEVPLFEGINKYDFEENTCEVHLFGEGRFGGEAVFAARSDDSTEDAGWLVTFVYDENEQQSELVIVDAQNITSEPVARVIIPQRVPYGFHGTWVSQEQLQ